MSFTCKGLDEDRGRMGIDTGWSALRAVFSRTTTLKPKEGLNGDLNESRTTPPYTQRQRIGLLALGVWWSVCGEVSSDAAVERALCFEDVLDSVADGAFAAPVIGDDVGLVLDLFAGVGDGEGQAAGAHDGKVDDVIADEGSFFGCESLFGENLAEGRKLVRDALVDVLDLEIAAAEANGLRGALGDEAGLNSAEARQREGGTVVSVEALGFDHDVSGSGGFAGLKVQGLGQRGHREKKELAIGHHPIDIQQQELYLLCTSLGHGRIVASGRERSS